MTPTYYITTLGCPKNQADSREMERSLRESGFQPAESALQADYHLINSCAFIRDAKEETIDVVFESAEIKRHHEGQKLILLGCFSQRYGEAVETEIPEVDLHFGTGSYHRAGQLLRSVFEAEPDREKGGEMGPLTTLHPPHAPVKISEGCNRGCSFCSIPLIRGPHRDLEEEAIVEECRRLADEGVREVDLVSQDTSAYGGGDPEKMLRLLERLHGIDSLPWIRILYLYPENYVAKLWEGIVERGLERVVPYLESPVQHVSKHLLRAMNRPGDYERYRDLFARVRSLRKDLEIRTSFLLGYPGETLEDVDRVVDFIREVRPEKVALFGYSPEEGTPSEERGDPPPDLEERINLVRQEHLEVLRGIHQERVGRIYTCMVDEITEEGALVRRPQDAPEVDEMVHLPPVEGIRPGQLIQVRITGFYEYDMEGEPVTGEGV